MFSFKYAIFCMLAGLLAGWCFDKKNDIPIVGIFTYIFVVNAFSLVFDYDYSWAFLAFIEMLAGHGLYKMGFGNFLGELFSTSELKKETNKIVTASKAAKTAYISRKTTRTVVSSKPLSKGETIKKTSIMLAKKGAETIVMVVLFFFAFMFLLYVIGWIINLFG
jgi:hypothetical protein